MNFDKVLLELGEFGPWQICITLLLWLPAAIDGMMSLMASYTALVPEAYRCNIPGCDGEQFRFSDFAKQKLFPSFNESSPEYNPGKPNFCRYYKPHILDNGTCSSQFSSDVLECGSSSSFTYDQDTFVMDSTLVTDFSMLCDASKEVWIPMFNSCFMVGLAIGSFLFGILSDNLGRRHTLLIAIILCSVSSIAGSYMPNYWSYAIFRILVGAGSEGCYIVAFTMSMEIVGIRERVPGLKWVSYSTFQGNMIMIPFALGEVMVSLAAMMITTWSDLEQCVSIASLGCATIWIFIPESPRWLIAQGENEKAREVIHQAGRENGVKTTGAIFTDDDGTDETKNLPQFGLLDIFHSSIIKSTLALFVCWPIITILYYGLTFSADKIHLSSNTYASFIIITLVEIPASLLLILVMDIWGRKPLLVLSLLVPGVSCIAAALLEEGVVFAICVLVGKCFAAGAFNIVHIFTAELYPTSIRTSMLGACSTIARIGGVFAPWVAVYLPDQGSFDKDTPLYIFGLSSVAGGLMALLLPETLGFFLPNTFEDVEDMRRNGKSMWTCVDPRQAGDEEDSGVEIVVDQDT